MAAAVATVVVAALGFPRVIVIVPPSCSILDRVPLAPNVNGGAAPAVVPRKSLRLRLTVPRGSCATLAASYTASVSSLHTSDKTTVTHPPSTRRTTTSAAMTDWGSIRSE